LAGLAAEGARVVEALSGGLKLGIESGVRLFEFLKADFFFLLTFLFGEEVSDNTGFSGKFSISVSHSFILIINFINKIVSEFLSQILDFLLRVTDSGVLVV